MFPIPSSHSASAHPIKMHQCVDIKRYCQTVDGIFPDGKNGRRKPWFWSERALTMLTDVSLKNLKSKSKVYKVADRDGMYVAVAPSGQITFRYDYRLNGRRGTLTIGRYGRDGISLASPRRGSGAGRGGKEVGCSSVDFPLPDGPSSTTTSPAQISRSMPCSASTCTSPDV